MKYRNWLVLFVAVVFCAVLVEGTFRFVIQPPQTFDNVGNDFVADYFNAGNFVFHEELNYIFSPQLMEALRKDNERFVTKPGVKSILILGDSLVASGFLRESLQKIVPPDVHIWSAGIGGYNTMQEAEFLESEIKAEPSAIILSFCLNDFLPTMTAVPDRFHPSLYKTNWNPIGIYNRFWFNHVATYRFLKLRQMEYKAGQHWSSMMPKINRANVKGAIRKIQEYSKRQNAPLFVAVYPHFADYSDPKFFGRHFLPVAHATIIEILNELRIPFLDLHEIYKGIPHERLKDLPHDVVHPSREAQALAANAIWPKVAALLGFLRAQ